MFGVDFHAYKWSARFDASYPRRTAPHKWVEHDARRPTDHSMHQWQWLFARVVIPDKQALGWWYRQTSLNQQTRESFAKAGENRSPEMQWDNLFPDGKNEIYLDLSVTAKSLGNKVDDYISAHNATALEKYAAAQQLDEQSHINNPKAYPKAGKSIDQQLIRRDPTNPIKMIQTLNPGKQDATWSPPRSLEKFLQDQLEWALYDDLQLEKVDEKQIGEQESLKTKVDLTKVANHDLIAADELFEANELKIVVSRDPQKIGEMSTGQRWRSCMASDGVNFHFVPYDIAAGSLVAYVVHKDDPDARYPLMRQLIKPFHNEKGETILVPARIYGGMENTNSRTRDALRHSLNQFVSKQNEGVTGEFSMDSQLYADGQATTLRLQGEWTFPDIRKAMVEYQGGAIEEWLVELRQAMSHARTNTLGPHGETPEQQIAELKGKLRHVVIADDMADGLPRMFHREMRRASIGSIPDPKLIKDAVSEDSSVVKQSKLFNALIKNDPKKVDALLESAVGGDLIGILQTAAIAAVTSKPGSPAEALAANKLIWAIECIASTDGRTETYLKYARLATHGSLLDELMTILCKRSISAPAVSSTHHPLHILPKSLANLMMLIPTEFFAALYTQPIVRLDLWKPIKPTKPIQHTTPQRSDCHWLA